MTLHLDAQDLRAVNVVLDLLDQGVPIQTAAGVTTDGWVVLSGIRAAATAAAAADPECPFCDGYGIVLLPYRGADGEGEVEEASCPVCRPWPQGFPGYHGRRPGGYIIPPYGPGERGAFIPPASEDDVLCAACYGSGHLFRSAEPCGECGGSGRAPMPTTEPFRCPQCPGTRTVVGTLPDGTRGRQCTLCGFAPHPDQPNPKGAP